MTAYEEKYKGYTIKIENDEYPENPREICSDLGKMICFHKNYNLGDKHDYKFPNDFVFDLAYNHFNQDTVDEDFQELSSADFQTKYLTKLEKYYIFLNLYLYDHSGITINTTGFPCPWDSGQVGWIYISKEDIRKEYSVKKISKKLFQKVEDLLRGEVEVFDRFIRGDVYYWVVEENDGEVIDSCGGYYSEPEGYVLEEARQTVDSYKP